jgi:hypothetical protein
MAPSAASPPATDRPIVVLVEIPGPPPLFGGVLGDEAVVVERSVGVEGDKDGAVLELDAGKCRKL